MPLRPASSDLSRGSSRDEMTTMVHSVLDSGSLFAMGIASSNVPATSLQESGSHRDMQTQKKKSDSAPIVRSEKNSLNIKFLGGIFLGHPGPRRRDIPDKNFMQVALFCCFRQGVPGMSRDLGRDVLDLEKLYARKLWVDFSYPTLEDPGECVMAEALGVEEEPLADLKPLGKWLSTRQRRDGSRPIKVKAKGQSKERKGGNPQRRRQPTCQWRRSLKHRAKQFG